MTSVEQRLAKLEREMAALKREQSKSGDLDVKKPGWISKITGAFENDPDFDEILRLGHDERKADILNDE